MAEDYRIKIKVKYILLQHIHENFRTYREFEKSWNFPETFEIALDFILFIGINLK